MGKIRPKQPPISKKGVKLRQDWAKNRDFSNFGSLLIPTYIFTDRSVAVLEAISEFLKDTRGLTYHEIAVALNRDDRTIWTAYNRARKKHANLTPKIHNCLYIPLRTLANRDLSILEAVVVFLKERKGLRYSEIADLIGRNDRTVWTVYNRAKKKMRWKHE